MRLVFCLFLLFYSLILTSQSSVLRSQGGIAWAPAANTGGTTATDTLLDRILAESRRGSELEKHLRHLTDVTGSRLMGTSGYHQAAWYANSTLLGWGLERVAFENFDRDYRGWELYSFNLELVSPSYEHIPAWPRAYTSPTGEAKKAEVIYLESTADTAAWRGRLRGKAVLLGEQYHGAPGPADFSLRTLTEAELAAAVANPDPNDRQLGYFARRSTVTAIARKEEHHRSLQAFHRFLKQEGAAALLEPSHFGHGLLTVDGWGMTPVLTGKNDLEPAPAFVITREAFGRLQRLCTAGRTVEVRIDQQSKFTDSKKFNVNVIAEILGSDPDLRNELIVIGAHLDSWHGGTGATDNAANCATLLETVRILQAMAARPRRTIRLVLWGGHEQNFLGSRHYIESRIGALDGSRYGKERDLTSLYLNLDNGAGRIRGLYLMGNDRIRPHFAAYLAPFPESHTLTLQNANQSDHEFFDWMGVPGFQFIQDPLNYIPVTHHTQLDQPEYLRLEDLQYNAELVAYLALRAADEDQRLPRKPYHSPAPIRDGKVRIFLPGFPAAREVSLTGTFNNWMMYDTKLARVEGGWECRLNLPPGRYLYQFIVDGRWTADPTAAELLEDELGHAGLAELIVEGE